MTGRFVLGSRSTLPLVGAILALVATAGAPGAATGQEGAVTGRVIQASNFEPLVGAQVFLPDLDQGTLTNAEGRYRITGVPAGTHRVRSRLLGFRPVTRTVTVEAGGTAAVDFELSISAVSLSEIVVTQTGTQVSRELGRAVTTIDATEEVQRSRSSTIQDLLKGRSTGAVIRSSSGSVGAGSTFQIRGNATLSLDNTPLIYIDGVRVSNTNDNLGGQFSGNFFTGGQQTSRLSDIRPEDIESIQVLKGPSATTLYGSEAASGVLVIETKRGTSEDARWTGRAEAGGNWDSTDWMGVAYKPTEDPSFPLTFATFESLFGVDLVPDDQENLLVPGVKDTVYLFNALRGGAAGMSSPFRTGFEQDYGATVRGGISEGDVTYYASGGYEDLEGNLPTNRVTKWGARLNFGVDAGERTDLSFSSAFTSNVTELPQNDNNGFGIVSQSLLGISTFGPFDRSDPRSGGEVVRTCPLFFELSRSSLGPALGLGIGDLGACPSPLVTFPTFEDAFLTRTTDDTQRFTGSATVNYRPWDFLTGRLTVGYDEFDQTNTQINPVVPRLVPVSQVFVGTLQKAKTRASDLTINASSTAEADLADRLRSTTTVGLQWFDENSDQIFVQCQEFPAGSPACDNAVRLDQTGSNDFFVGRRTLGVYAEQQLAWRDVVYLTAGARVDDNSAFGDELTAELFPQASLSWVLSDEAWFPELFEQFKLRGAWGQSGEQPATNAAFSLLGANPATFRGQDVISVTSGAEPDAANAPAQPGNPDLSPARVTELELGFDMSVLEGRLSGELTWYRQTTRDDIVTRPLPPSTGFAEPQFTNVGELVNTGIEAAVNATAFSMPDLVWDWRVQVSTNSNEITELTNPIDLGFEQRHQEGRSFAAYHDNAVFFDPSGEIVETDGAVFEAPGVPGGDPTPNVNGSLSSSLTLFEHVTMYGLAEWATGHQMHSNTQEFTCFFINECARVFRVDPETGGPSREARLLRAAGPPGAELNFVEDADYVKLRTVSLRFDVPEPWTRFFGGRDLSLQLTGENLAHWSGFFQDPEATSGGQEQNGFFSDFATVPPAKRVTASLQVSF